MYNYFNIRKMFKEIFAVVLTALLLFNFSCFASDSAINASENIEVEIAPLNPEFVEYINNAGNKDIFSDEAGDNAQRGYIPPPFSIKHKASDDKDSATLFEALPVSYSSVQYQTPAKNQIVSGPCWSFAANAALESFLLKKGDLIYDFSERNMMNNNGYDYAYNQGGNSSMAIGYLARWGGPVLEGDDYAYNYPSSETKGFMPDKVVKHVQGVYFIPDLPSASARISSSLNEIKKAVMEYGAVATSMYWADEYYNRSKNAYYYNGAVQNNHGIVIVGWDDNYSKYNFNSYPSGNGAFIIKNSWGTDFGDNGYFYISYYDTSVGKYNYCYTNVENCDNYDNIYQYDELGMIGAFSANSSSKTGWFANVFQSSSGKDELLEAVSFYTIAAGCTYEIHVNSAYSGPSIQGLKKVRSGTIANPGYHTIKLDNSIKINKGDKFIVAVKITTPNYDEHPIPIEVPVPNYSSMATASRNQSYFSLNGNNWYDMTDYSPNTNVCLKAFTSDYTSKVSFTTTSYSVRENNSITLNIERESGIGSVSFDYTTVDGTAKEGTDYIKASGTISMADGEKTSSITVKVNDDTEIEGNEFFYVHLLDPTGSVEFGSAIATIFIEDHVTISSGLTIAPPSVRAGRTELSQTLNFSSMEGPVNDTITAAVNIRNDNPSAANVKLILALIKHENGQDKLERVSLCSVDSIQSNQLQQLSTSMNVNIEEPEKYKLKVYLWDSFTNRIPYMPAQEF